MKSYLGLSFCLFLVCLSALHAKQSGTKDDTSAGRRALERQIVALEHRYWQAWKDRDPKTLLQIRAADFREADHDGVWDKKQTEQGDPDLETTAFTMSNEKVSVLQPDVALLTYEIAYKASYQGKDISSSHSYIASLYARRKSDWQLVYTQESLANDSQAIEKAAVSSKPPADQFFIEKEKEVWEALRDKDKAAATRLLADDFVGMYDFGFFNKSEWIKQIDEQYTVDDYTILEPKILHPSPTTVLLLYTATCKATGSWADYCSNTSRISDLWVERNGDWLALFSQDTTAVKSAQAAQNKEIQTESNNASNAAKQEIIGIERSDWEAVKTKNKVAMERVRSDDYFDFGSDGRVDKTKGLSEGWMGANSTLLDFSWQDLQVNFLGDSTALVTYRGKYRSTTAGKEDTGEAYYTTLYQKRQGKLLIVFTQDSNLKCAGM